MKKTLFFILLIIISLNTSFISVNADMSDTKQEISVYLDGSRLNFDVEPMIKNGRTLVPFRMIFESLGAKVDWDDSTRTCIALKGNISVTLTIDSLIMNVNNTQTTLDCPPILYNSRTLVPLRAISEALQCEVGWDGVDGIVSIINNKNNYTMLYAEGGRSRSFSNTDVLYQKENGWHVDKDFINQLPGSNTDGMAKLDSGICGDNLKWELLSDGTLHIFGAGPMYDYNKNINPSPWFKYRNEPYVSDDGKQLLNPNGSVYYDTINYYKDNPHNYKVKNIIIEKGVTYLGDWAFYRICVEKLVIPEGVESTGYFCIRYSPTLKEITLPNSLRVLNDFAISRNQVLKTINFGNGIEEIGRAGLQNNPELEEVIFPKSLKSINEQLHSPYYPDKDYSNLGLLEGCSSLIKIDFGSVESIPQRTCNGTNLEIAVIPSCVKYIEEYAFLNNKNLKEVIFEKNSECKLIKNKAFLNCISLEKIYLSKNIKEIKDGAFLGCTNLKDIYYDGSLQEFKLIYEGRNWSGGSTPKDCVVHFLNGSECYLSEI